ncbi:hypothetical protein NIES22_04070 [Calothrix brevissima NIES-22]|nr:hypothetical protein NIES22_04070 [Calothrix brevissima NIES-22]
MSDTPADSIWIVTDDTPQIATPDNNQSGNFRGINRSDETRETTGSKGVTDAVPVSAQKLEQEMTKFLGVVGRLFNQAEQQTQVKSGIQLEEIELSIEISGEGEVKLIGSGAKASGKGAIKLTFKRQAAN